MWALSIQACHHEIRDPLYDEIEKVPEVIISTVCKCSLPSFQVLMSGMVL